eukprot:c4186_g1_i2.p1 GENE.c4186_g1_i2~~c4186_g1_i2.p1  ORF type:complete len:392 (-),score=72.07 c4186_g1_i2:107-1282(-)
MWHDLAYTDAFVFDFNDPDLEQKSQERLKKTKECVLEAEEEFLRTQKAYLDQLTAQHSASNSSPNKNHGSPEELNGNGVHDADDELGSRRQPVDGVKVEHIDNQSSSPSELPQLDSTLNEKVPPEADASNSPKANTPNSPKAEPPSETLSPSHKPSSPIKSSSPPNKSLSSPKSSPSAQPIRNEKYAGVYQGLPPDLPPGNLALGSPHLPPPHASTQLSRYEAGSHIYEAPPVPSRPRDLDTEIILLERQRDLLVQSMMRSRSYNPQQLVLPPGVGGVLDTLLPVSAPRPHDLGPGPQDLIPVHLPPPRHMSPPHRHRLSDDVAIINGPPGYHSHHLHHQQQPQQLQHQHHQHEETTRMDFLARSSAWERERILNGHRLSKIDQPPGSKFV